MPIKDLQTNEYGFPEGGRIRLGIKKLNNKGTEYPVETDYFVMNDAQDLIPAYGDTPKELLVFLPYQERDKNFRAYYELFKTGGLYCQGDGENITWAIDPGGSGQVVIRDSQVIHPYTEEDGTPKNDGNVPCSGKYRNDNPFYTRCKSCKARALLFVLVRDPREPMRLVNNRLAYYRLSTRSIYNIVGITESLNMISGLAAARNKSLVGIPLILRRTEKTIAVSTTNKEGKATRAQVTKHFLAFEADPKWTKFASLGLAAGAMDIPIDELLSLPEGAVIDADIVDEDLYTPDELVKDVDERVASVAADIYSLKDSLPNTLGEMHSILAELYGAGYKSDKLVIAVRQRLQMARTDKFEVNHQTWNAALELMLERIGAI